MQTISLTAPAPSAFSTPQRQCHLLLLLYLSETPVTLISLSQLNQVEQSITRQDITEVAAEIQRYHRLRLIPDAQGYYRIVGAEWHHRLCLLHWLRRALRLVPDFVRDHLHPR
ncbi:hypothetical protein ACFFW8_24410 [Erwinia tracheiphila]